MNIQTPITPIEKDGELEIQDIFYTLQGEGPFSGKPAVFVRLAYCNLQCPWCDTDYTSKVRSMDIPTIVSYIESNFPACCLIVITGGEPLQQDISLLCSYFLDSGRIVQIETNGSITPSGMDITPPNLHFVVSPKTGHISKELFMYSSNVYLKYVVSEDDCESEDGLPVYPVVGKVPPARPPSYREVPIYLSPLDSNNKSQNYSNKRVAADLCKSFGHTLSLQVHKEVGLE